MITEGESYIGFSEEIIWFLCIDFWYIYTMPLNALNRRNCLLHADSCLTLLPLASFKRIDNHLATDLWAIQSHQERMSRLCGSIPSLYGSFFPMFSIFDLYVLWSSLVLTSCSKTVAFHNVYGEHTHFTKHQQPWSFICARIKVTSFFQNMYYTYHLSGTTHCVCLSEQTHK